MAWVKLNPLVTKAGSAEMLDEPQPVFSAGNDPEGTILAAEGQEDMRMCFALTFGENGRSNLFRDGRAEDY